MALDFVLPEGLLATEPPPARDGVRLLVASPSGMAHARFTQLGEFLSPGDLVVVNTSATLAAAVDGNRGGAVHVNCRRPSSQESRSRSSVRHSRLSVASAVFSTLATDVSNLSTLRSLLVARLSWVLPSWRSVERDRIKRMIREPG